MLTFKQLLLSKTFWAVVGTFAFNGFQAIEPQLATDPHTATFVNVIGAALAIYGRANPKQIPKV